MSEVMRFNMIPSGQPNPAFNGLYVRHEDYLRLEQERTQLLADANMYRQWFNAVQDLNPKYLEAADYQAAKKLLEYLGMRVPRSVFDKALSAKP